MKFYKSSQFWDRNAKWFSYYKSIVLAQLPDARVEHIGSSAVVDAISKGDLDIFVGVPAKAHSSAIEKLEHLGFKVKQNTLRTEELCMLESAEHEEVAIQVVANGSKYEFFLFFRDELLKNKSILDAYNKLKINCTGKTSEKYRAEKSKFIEKILFS